MSEMAVKFLMLLWQGQLILARPSSKTSVESLYEKYIQATIICNVQHWSCCRTGKVESGT